MARHASVSAPSLFSSVVAIVMGVVAFTACGSVPDITFAAADGGSSGSSGSSGGPCVPSGPEICDDGIDNDCNGRTDCSDNACQSGFTCVDRAPDDSWQLAALAESSRPGCPSGYGDGKDVRSVVGSAAGGAAACTCDCGGTGACAAAGIDLDLGGDNTCADTKQHFSVKQCEPLNAGGVITVTGSTFAKATAGTTPQCTPNPQSSPTPLEDGRLCAAPKRVGGGCKGSQVCVPRASNGYSVCITKPGVDSCPGSFSDARRAGTSANDTRACTGCSCASSPCTGQVQLYDTKNCDNGPRLTVDTTAPGVCAAKTNNPFTARGQTTTVSGGCNVATPARATGSLSFGDESTICCRPGGGGGGGGNGNGNGG